MRILQPAEWSKPRGFSHGVAVDGPGRWIVLAGQTGGDEKGEYQPDMAGQVAVALRRIIKLLAEAGAGPEHIVRLTWYLTSRSEYEAAGAGIGAAWRETLGRNFPPSTLLYIAGLVDATREGRDRSHRIRTGGIGRLPMTKRSTSADFVTAFATGWPGKPARNHGAFVDHAQRRSGFCAQQGTGAVDRKNHEGNRRPAGQAQKQVRRDEPEPPVEPRTDAAKRL